MKFKGKLFWIVSIFIIGCFSAPAFSYAQNSGSAVANTIGYFYSASEQMIDAEDNSGVMSSYLTRGERYNGTSETFAVSNIKDITADLDSNGNIINKYTYTAYGTQTSYSSTSNIQHPTLSINTNPFTYSDYYTDRESGNYYLNARYYDSTLGIFLTSDSYNLPNRYMYVNGDPIMGTDPMGHWTFDLGCFGTFFGGAHSVDGNWHHWGGDIDSIEKHKNYQEPQNKQNLLKQDVSDNQKQASAYLSNPKYTYTPNENNKLYRGIDFSPDKIKEDGGMYAHHGAINASVKTDDDLTQLKMAIGEREGLDGRVAVYGGNRGLSTSPYLSKALWYGGKAAFQYIYVINPNKISDKMYNTNDNEIKVNNFIPLSAIEGYYKIPKNQKPSNDDLNGKFHKDSDWRLIAYNEKDEYFIEKYKLFYNAWI